MKVEWPLLTITAQAQEERPCLEKREGLRVLRPICTGRIKYRRHIILPCQIRPVFSLEEVSVRCCAAVVASQMDQHMAWPLLFRCRVCCVTLNEAQVHVFKTFTAQYGNVYRLLLCPLYFITAFPKEWVCSSAEKTGSEQLYFGCKTQKLLCVNFGLIYDFQTNKSSAHCTYIYINRSVQQRMEWFSYM